MTPSLYQQFLAARHALVNPYDVLTASALDLRRLDANRHLLPRAQKALVDMLVASIEEGYANRVVNGGRVSAAVRTALAKPAFDVRRVAAPYLRPIRHSLPSPFSVQVPALYLNMPTRTLNADALGKAILKALKAVLPDENFAEYFPPGIYMGTPFNHASDLIDALNVACLIVRNDENKVASRQSDGSSNSEDKSGAQPSFLVFMSEASSRLNVSVLFVTEAKLEDTAEPELVHSKRVSTLSKGQHELMLPQQPMKAAPARKRRSQGGF